MDVYVGHLGMAQVEINKRDSWRIQTDKFFRSGSGGFDEIVVGRWFHMERMDTDVWSLIVGEDMVMITVDSHGKSKIGQWYK